jgi:hypothetical protein
MTRRKILVAFGLLDSTPVKPTPQQVEPATREGGGKSGE